MRHLKFYVRVLIGLLCLVPHRASAKIEHPMQPDTAKECAICHYRWVSTFFLEHRGTPLVPLQEEQMVGAQEMCLSCHDGSIRDSRDKICNDPGHRVGIVPSHHVKIPERFPLDQNGAMQCTTCHTPHALKSKEGILVEYFLRAPNKNSSFCKLCHIENTGGKRKGNHPIDITAKRIPADIIKAGGMLGTDKPNQIICETCHIPHGGVNNKFLVLSAEDPKTRSVLCEVCHTKMPGRGGNPMRHYFSHPLDLSPGKAVQIPKKWRSGESVILGTGGELICRTCHKPHHAADHEYLLAKHQGQDLLCMDCHTQQALIEGTEHDLTITGANFKNVLDQVPRQGGICSPCHVVHTAQYEKYLWAGPLGQPKLTQWKEPYRSDKNFMVMLCTGCHSEGNVAKNQIPQFGLHPRGLTFPVEKSGPLNQPFPIYNDLGELSPDGNIVCSTCHNPHQWNSQHNIKGPGIHVEGNATNSFLREEVRETFCTVCHGEDSLFKFKYFHSPIGRGKEQPFSLFKQKEVKKR